MDHFRKAPQLHDDLPRIGDYVKAQTNASMTRRGAARLQRIIAAYWRDRGYPVPKFEIVQDAELIGAKKDARSGIARGENFVLRSDMLKGLPRG